MNDTIISHPAPWMPIPATSDSLFDIFPLTGSDLAGFMAALAAIAAIIVSIGLYLENRKPDIMAYLEHDSDKTTISLIVRNFGNGIARDIRASNLNAEIIQPELRTAIMNGFVSKGVPMLVPGDSRKTIICTAMYANTQNKDEKTSIALSYKRKTFLGRWKTEETDDFELDLYSFLGSLNTKSDVHQIKNNLESINKNLKAINGSIKTLSQSRNR